MPERPIHILHVVPTLGVGGLELTMARLVRRLSNSDMQHTICCLTGDPIIQDRFDQGVDIHCMHADRNGKFLPFRLAGLLRRLRPSAIHARNWPAWPDIALAALMVRPTVPVIWSFHGFESTGPVPFRRRFACRLLALITAHLFAVSQAARDGLARDVGLPAARISVIPNGVDTSQFKPITYCPNRGTFTIGTVGNLTPVKNQALLLRAAGLLARRGLDFRLEIGGEGPQREALLALSAELGIQDRLRLLGHVRDVPVFLHSLDLFVLPSRSEAHPNALLEAMACGIPCVATAVGGAPEVLDRGRCGLLVPDDDVEALAETIGLLASAPSQRQELAKAGADWAGEQYSLDRMVERYRRLYLTIVNPIPNGEAG